MSEGMGEAKVTNVQGAAGSTGPALASEAQVAALTAQSTGSSAQARATRAVLSSMGAYQGSPLDLHALPADVAQQIIEARGDAMQQFFDSWSQSIAENAKRDVEAATRRDTIQRPQVEAGLKMLAAVRQMAASRETSPTPAPRAGRESQPTDHAEITSARASRALTAPANPFRLAAGLESPRSA